MGRTVDGSPGSPPDHEFLILGAGLCGIGAGITLLRAGIDDFVIVDRADSAGGTWRQNTYPGIGVDVPTVAYEYSFARNPRWSSSFPYGAEINGYHNKVAEEFGLGPHFRFNTDVAQQVWDDDNHMWRLHIADGRVITTRYLIVAIGQFSDSRLPDIPGVTEFKGKVQQPALWDHSYDHRGKRVGVVGTGASAVQIIPSVAPEVGNLEVYQRTPIYCVPRPDFPIPDALGSIVEARIFWKPYHVAATIGFDLLVRTLTSVPLPVAARVLRGFDAAAKGYYRRRLRSKVLDPATRAALMPSHGGAAKRPALSNTYLPAFNRDNVQLITAPIEQITPRGIRTTDGVEHQLDMMVLATGYHFFADAEFYRSGWVVGRDGFDLGDFFAEHGVQAYESAAVPGLPNRWMLSGPYSWSHTPHTMSEILTRSIIRATTAAKRSGATAIEVTKEAHEAYHAKTLARGRNFQWYFEVLNKDAKTYYINSQGTVAGIRFVSWTEMLLKSVTSPLADYTCRRAWPPTLNSSAAEVNSAPLESEPV